MHNSQEVSKPVGVADTRAKSIYVMTSVFRDAAEHIIT